MVQVLYSQSMNPPPLQTTQCGCDHEKQAIETYRVIQLKHHQNFYERKSRFVISMKYSHLGTTPDSILSCDCCGTGTLEVKCPFCIRNKHISESLDKKTSVEMQNGALRLKREHPHFYQCQSL